MVSRPTLSWLAIFGAVGLMGCAAESVIEDSAEPRQPVEAQASVDRAVATTGDLITYRITVDADAGYEIEIPEAGAEIAGFRIVNVGREEPQTRNGRTVSESWYELRADLVGSYVLPPVEVGYRQLLGEGEQSAAWETLVTSEIFVEVESVLPTEGGAEDIRGLKPLREVQPPIPWLQIVLGLIGAALAGAALWWYLRQRAKRKDDIPLIPPHEVAFEALSRLRSTDFDDPVSVRLFYFQISEVVRTYVEGRFGMNATDLTTEEILANLESLDQLAPDQSEVLRAFLMDTDQVKFAHREPGGGDIENVYEQALSFVESTRPVVEEETETEPEAMEQAA